MTNTDNLAVSPLMMGETIIGTITVNLETAEFTGRLDQEAADILRLGIKDGSVKSVTLASFYGLAARHDMSVHERWAAYLSQKKSTNAPQIEFWSVYSHASGDRVLTNLRNEDEARLGAQQLHRQTGQTYYWAKHPSAFEEN